MGVTSGSVHSSDGSQAQPLTERIRISALTEFVGPVDRSGRFQLKVLVEFLDTSDNPSRAVAMWRFELYAYHARSSDPRGRRIVIWPDYDLTASDAESGYWKDFLQGYEFYLPLEFVPAAGSKYVLEATCAKDQQRYSDLFKVHCQP